MSDYCFYKAFLYEKERKLCFTYTQDTLIKQTNTLEVGMNWYGRKGTIYQHYTPISKGHTCSHQKNVKLILFSVCVED